jgi:uncharacterized metal-binding protein
MTRVVLRPLPVLYACAGCSEFGYSAIRVARALDARGLAEAIWLGDTSLRVTGRYPVFTLEACGKGCAQDWVHARGARVEKAFVLEPQERDVPEAATARLAAKLGPRLRGGDEPA